MALCELCSKEVLITITERDKMNFFTKPRSRSAAGDEYSTHFAGSHPKCASKEQFSDWMQEARSNKPVTRIGFCEDCTIEYQSRMIQCGRCENPGVFFVHDDDGWLSGTLPTTMDVQAASVIETKRKRIKREAKKLTLLEAADFLEDNTGVEGWLHRLIEAVKQRELEVSRPGEKTRYYPEIVSIKYEEVCMRDLEEWYKCQQPVPART